MLLLLLLLLLLQRGLVLMGLDELGDLGLIVMGCEGWGETGQSESGGFIGFGAALLVEGGELVEGVLVIVFAEMGGIERLWVLLGGVVDL
jgi:hypothetical protein